MSDFKTPIVLDTGSGLMKAGFADQDLPNIIFPTIIGMPKYEVRAHTYCIIYCSLQNKSILIISNMALLPASPSD